MRRDNEWYKQYLHWWFMAYEIFDTKQTISHSTVLTTWILTISSRAFTSLNFHFLLLSALLWNLVSRLTHSYRTRYFLLLLLRNVEQTVLIQTWFAHQDVTRNYSMGKLLVYGITKIYMRLQRSTIVEEPIGAYDSDNITIDLTSELSFSPPPNPKIVVSSVHKPYTCLLYTSRCV